MSNISSKTFSSLKYVYLIIFFALLSGIFYPLITGLDFDFSLIGILILFCTFLSGFFHPIINNYSFDVVLLGVLTLFLGLAGGVLLYKTTTVENKRGIFFGAGFGLIGFSLFMIFDIAIKT